MPRSNRRKASRAPSTGLRAPTKQGSQTTSAVPDAVNLTMAPANSPPQAGALSAHASAAGSVAKSISGKQIPIVRESSATGKATGSAVKPVPTEVSWRQVPVLPLPPFKASSAIISGSSTGALLPGATTSHPHSFHPGTTGLIQMAATTGPSHAVPSLQPSGAQPAQSVAWTPKTPHQNLAAQTRMASSKPPNTVSTPVAIKPPTPARQRQPASSLVPGVIIRTLHYEEKMNQAPSVTSLSSICDI